MLSVTEILKTSFSNINKRLLCAGPLACSDEWDLVLVFKTLRVCWADKDVQEIDRKADPTSLSPQKGSNCLHTSKGEQGALPNGKKEGRN